MEIAEITEIFEVPAAEVRRFYLADLTDHGPWLLERLLRAYPSQNQRSIIGWLNGVIDNNEFLCLLMPEAKAVCFAERAPLDRLSGQMVVREIFVWVEDPSNIAQVGAAVQFYNHMKTWAKSQGITQVIVCERSDVPEAQVRKANRLHETKALWMRV